MKKLLFLLGISIGFLATAQQMKKDSANADLNFYDYKPRIYYPVDCSCPDKVIYKEAKPGDKNFNPYQYKEIRPIRIDSLPKEMQKEILEHIYRKA